MSVTGAWPQDHCTTATFNSLFSWSIRPSVCKPIRPFHLLFLFYYLFLCFFPFLSSLALVHALLLRYYSSCCSGAFVPNCCVVTSRCSWDQGRNWELPFNTEAFWSNRVVLEKFVIYEYLRKMRPLLTFFLHCVMINERSFFSPATHSDI